MAGGLVSDKKRSRLQALECRLSSSSPANNPVLPLPPHSNELKPLLGSAHFRGPAYAKLSKLAFDGPVIECLQVSFVEDNRNTVNTIVRELVQGSGKAVRNLDSILDSQVQERVLLLDNPAGHGKAVERARRRAKQSLANRSSKHLSKRQHKLIGSYDLPLQYHKFDLFRPMHEMWKAYAREIVNDNRGKMIEPSLLHMDFHGAFLAVVAAKIDNQVGVEGIMIRETINTFTIMTMANKLKVIAKEGSVFALRMDNMRVILYGDQIRVRPGMQKP